MKRKELFERIKELLDNVSDNKIKVSNNVLAELILTTIEESYNCKCFNCKKFIIPSGNVS